MAIRTIIRVSDLHQLESRLASSLKSLKMDKEGLLMQKNKLTVQSITVEKRLSALNKEILRVKEHTGVLIDTNVWVEGVIQRCHKKELSVHLQRELHISTEKMQSINIEVERIRQKLLDASETISKLKRDTEKLINVSKLFHKALSVFKSTAIQGIVKNLSDLQDQAVETERRRARERDIEKRMGKLSSKTGNDMSSIELVRRKDTDLRTKEER